MDTARVLSRYVDGIMARTYAHRTVTDLAAFATVPVINGLTDLSHPCQVMADYFTAWEKFGELKGRKLAYVGDGNNMAHSLMFGAPKVGMHVAVATPAGYAPDPTIAGAAQADADAAGTKVVVTTSIEEAVRGADVVETDVWASMGQEEEHAEDEGQEDDDGGGRARRAVEAGAVDETGDGHGDDGDEDCGGPRLTERLPRRRNNHLMTVADVESARKCGTRTSSRSTTTARPKCARSSRWPVT